MVRGLFPSSGIGQLVASERHGAHPRRSSSHDQGGGGIVKRQLETDETAIAEAREAVEAIRAAAGVELDDRKMRVDSNEFGQACGLCALAYGPCELLGTADLAVYEFGI